MGWLKQGTEMEFRNYIYLQGGYKMVLGQLKDLVRSETALSQYLAEQGVNETPVGAAFFAFPGSPILVWVKTDLQNLYITADCKSGNRMTTTPMADLNTYYTYTLYTEAEFAEKYAFRAGDLCVDGMRKESELPVLYNEDSAFLPITDVLVACGAIVTKESETQREFVMDDVELLLDLEEEILYKRHEDGALYQLIPVRLIGGMNNSYDYFANGDLMVNTESLWHLFRRIYSYSTIIPIDIGDTGVNIQLNGEGSDSTS